MPEVAFRTARGPEPFASLDQPGPDLVAPLLTWYAETARDLPWRAPDASPWAVLVSEVMLQQTPVARVLPAYETWLRRWPTPAALAAASPGEALRAWGRLGYPRRALRLHRCATVLVAQFGGQVPSDVDALLALPGIGSYTARAVAAFAFAQRHPVVDTNVRRVVARAVDGRAAAGGSAVAREHAAVDALLPGEPEQAARASAALMELGALVCTARSPRCGQCPLGARCTWRAARSPPERHRTPATQRYDGTDRQARGRLLGVLRGRRSPAPRAAFDAVWPDPVQRARALDSLVVDGLVDALPDGRFALVGEAGAPPQS